MPTFYFPKSTGISLAKSSKFIKRSQVPDDILEEEISSLTWNASTKRIDLVLTKIPESDASDEPTQKILIVFGEQQEPPIELLIDQDENSLSWSIPFDQETYPSIWPDESGFKKLYAFVWGTNRYGGVPPKLPQQEITITIDPEAPVLVTEPEVVSGSERKIGTPIGISDGTWTNLPTDYTYTWYRNGTTISGATANSYTPVEADDLVNLSVSVSASNEAGFAGYLLTVGEITAPAPVSTYNDDINLSIEQYANTEQIDISQYFTGINLVYTISNEAIAPQGPASIDMDTGILSINSDVLFDANVEIQISNSGGFVDIEFPLVIENSDPGLAFDLDAEDWDLLIHDNEDGTYSPAISFNVLGPETNGQVHWTTYSSYDGLTLEQGFLPCIYDESNDYWVFSYRIGDPQHNLMDPGDSKTNIGFRWRYSDSGVFGFANSRKDIQIPQTISVNDWDAEPFYTGTGSDWKILVYINANLNESDIEWRIGTGAWKATTSNGGDSYFLSGTGSTWTYNDVINNIKIRYTNSLGYVSEESDAKSVTIPADHEEPVDPPPALTSSEWSLVEHDNNNGTSSPAIVYTGNENITAFEWTTFVDVTDATSDHGYLPTIYNASNDYWVFDHRTGEPSHNEMAPGETKSNIGLRYKVSGNEEWSPISNNRRNFTTEGEIIDLPDDLPIFPNTHIALAKSKSLTTYDATKTGTDGAWAGPWVVALALRSLQGDTSCDAKLKQQLSHIISGGKEPQSGGNYSSQHEIYMTCAIAIAAKINRVWSTFSNNDKTKFNLLAEAQLYGNAFPISSSNVSPGKTMDETNYGRSTINPNHRQPKPESMLVAAAFLGINNAKNLLKNFDYNDFNTRLTNAGFTNIKNAFSKRGGQTIANFEKAIQGPANGEWTTFYGAGLSDYEKIFDEELYKFNLNHPVIKGIGSGDNGVTWNGSKYGVMLGNVNNMPVALGSTGEFKEFDSVDGNGLRSDVNYVLGSARPCYCAIATLIVYGIWNRSDADVIRIMNRLYHASKSLFYKTDTGYKDYSRGQGRVTWSASRVNGQAEKHGLGYSYDIGNWCFNWHGLDSI